MMTDPLQDQTVGEFIKENEGNLSIAVEVARAFPSIQREIVQRAMDALEKQLRSRLGEQWEVWNQRETVILKPYASVHFGRKFWGEIYVELQIQRREEAAIIGVSRDRQRPKMAVLDAAIDKTFAKMPGKANRWWAWYEELPAEYGNCNGPGLVEMQFRPKEVLNYWMERMLLVHKIASPVIDEFVQGK
jgi:hypothetical protein